jgi:hypothetical protein
LSIKCENRQEPQIIPGIYRIIEAEAVEVDTAGFFLGISIDKAAEVGAIIPVAEVD